MTCERLCDTIAAAAVLDYVGFCASGHCGVRLAVMLPGDGESPANSSRLMEEFVLGVANDKSSSISSKGNMSSSAAAGSSGTSMTRLGVLAVGSDVTTSYPK